MGHPFKKYENIILLLLLFVFASVLLAKSVKEKKSPNVLERAVLAVVAPLQKGVTITIGNVLEVWNHYIYLTAASKQNERLFKLLNEQKFKNNLMLEELKKYRRVERLLSFLPAGSGKFQLSNVVAWDSTNLAQTLVIDRGKQDGVKNGMVVITHQGLIGRIVLSTARASRVLMITDARSAVDAFVQESRVRLIVSGQNRNKFLVKYLSIDSDVKLGDVVVSSGLGGVYPKGLPIGTIASLEPDPGRLFYKAEITPSANMEHIEEVLVMTGNEHGADERPEDK